ncbi:MAG: spore cortex biosynthesis protein YabQ [Lachnospiraceae bacterium]|nr:spore cortex biosynthesis protein YabQ [Lachnospiraceae bacterium]
MSSVIRQETAVFLISILHGAALTFLYDFLRALRRCISHGLAALSLEDFLFWLLAGFLTFYLTFRETDGIIRGYVAVGILLGFFLYHLLLSCTVVALLTGLFRLLGRIVGLPCRILSTAVKKTCIFCKKRIEFARKSVYNVKKYFTECKYKRGNQDGRTKKKTEQKQSPGDVCDYDDCYDNARGSAGAESVTESRKR